MEEIEEWFKVKKYPHIGPPLTIRDYGWVKKYVYDIKKVQTHSFSPLIHKNVVQRRFRPGSETIAISPKLKLRLKTLKPRDTSFASHIDVMIFSKYNQDLANAYEEFIKDKPFEKSIVAYRKIPLEPLSKNNKCNIDFAKTAFEYIKNQEHRNLTVIIADVSSFFDCLDHKILKKQWCRVLAATSLPKDHYNLFKALTRIKYVKSERLFDAYNQSMFVKTHPPNQPYKNIYVRKKIANTKYFKNKNAAYYCSKTEFIKNNINLIEFKHNTTGIPQGSPISATLANIYMLDFDENICEYIESIKGFYQRYSDDLILVCNQCDEVALIKYMSELISGKFARLTIQNSKTKTYRFQKIDGIFRGCLYDTESATLKEKIPLTYLGFCYDGRRVLIKTAGFSKYYRSLKNGFARAAGMAMYSKNPDGSLFLGRLYKRFTYKGAVPSLKYRHSNKDPKVYLKTREYNWGNYLTYVYKANARFKSLNNNKDLIKSQSRKFWFAFHKLLKNSNQAIQSFRQAKDKANSLASNISGNATTNNNDECKSTTL